MQIYFNVILTPGFTDGRCRARILSDRTTDMVACLDVVCASPAVRIVLVKNFMAVGHDSWRTAGFRVACSVTSVRAQA